MTSEPSPVPPHEPAPAPRVPTATYRLQLRPRFPFSAAAQAVPRLARLGVSHLHLSPVLTAVPGSEHGYDVTDHASVRAELGGEKGLRKLSRTARAHGMGLILDIVPNHMAVPADTRLNRPLWSVLREGPESAYAHWFDIDWAAGGERILLPVLGGPAHTELGALRTAQDGTLRYGPHVLPLRAGTADLPLPRLLEAQHYRLAWWRLARTEINYRRFFTVSELIGVRVEDPGVFAATHATVLRLLREGVVDGLRVDHPDGLADPGAYLRRLHEATGGRWTVVEKILARGERLRGDWPVAGTTGYDALHHIDGLFTDPDGHAELVAHHREFTGGTARTGGDWTATVGHAARELLSGELAAETNRLTRVAVEICAGLPGLLPAVPARGHDRTALGATLRAALCELLVRLPVYRPYATAGDAAPPHGETSRAEDRAGAAMLESVAAEARTALAAPGGAEAVDVVRDLALGRLGDGPLRRDFTARFAQLSSALRAKSAEDTAFYRYTPLLSACEVGGDPGDPVVLPEEFHAHCLRMQHDWPAGGTVLSTHDTKRSADLRAALSVLSECPSRWSALLAEVAPDGGGSSTGSSRGGVGRKGAGESAGERGGAAPDAHTAWTAWQTALGLCANSGTGADGADAEEEGGEDGGGEEEGGGLAERLGAALLKSAREAGLRTTWSDPDEAYEAALARFVPAGPGGPPPPALTTLAAQLAPHVRANVLGMTLLQLTMPGVPDLYTGTERLRALLVDPDNRRPPRLLGRDSEGDAGTDGRSPLGLSAEKLRLTAAALRLRRSHPEWFLAGSSYTPLHAEGAAAAHSVAFVRSATVLPVVTRLSLRLREAGGWRDTVLPLPAGQWREVFTGRTVWGRCRAVELLGDSPIALLVRR